MSPLWAQDVLRDGISVLKMSPDLIKENLLLIAVPQTYRLESEIPGVQPSDKPGVLSSEPVKAGLAPLENPEVLLIPFGEIKTSYSGKSANDAILLLKRAINLTQLQYRSEQEYTPVSAQQTVDRVQFFMAKATQSKLSGCDIHSELPSEDSKFEDVQALSQEADYIYKIELGVTRLVINKTFFSTSLTGEAEARIIENNQISKKILVDSFGGGKIILEKFDTEGVESDNELKSATSHVVEYLADKLGDKLCRYFGGNPPSR